MFELKEKNKSFEGLSYSKSIILSNASLSKRVSFHSKSFIHNTQYSNDILKEAFKGKVKGTCPIHLCLNWLSNNKQCQQNLPTDITADHCRERMNINNKYHFNCKQSFVEKVITLIKYKINKRLNGNDKGIMKPRKKKSCISRLNFNTNKPCCNSNVNKENSDKALKGRIKYLSSNLSKTYTQDYETNLSSHDDSQEVEKSSQETNSSDYDSEHMLLKKISKIDYSNKVYPSDENDIDLDIVAEDAAIPLLITKSRSFRRKLSIDSTNVHEGATLYQYLESLCKKYNSKYMVPKNYNICYKFYIYMYPSTVDTNLLLFQRHELKNLSKFMDPFDFNQLITDTKADFLFDRRLKMIQNKSNCYIVLEPLTHVFINGLPHRGVNIYSYNYENIAKALTIMEDVMPQIMETSVFKNDLPITYSCKWSTKDMIVRPVRKSHRVEVSAMAWVNRIDPDRLFSSYNFILNDPNSDVYENRIVHKSLMIKEENNENVDDMSYDDETLKYAAVHKNKSVSELRTHSNLSNIYCEIAKEGVETPWLETDTKNSILNGTSNFLSNIPMKYHYLKRIKCPGSILKREIFVDDCALNFLFDKFHCNITRVDGDISAGDGVFSDNEQIKLTVVYNSKDELREFCRALGLCIKLK